MKHFVIVAFIFLLGGCPIPGERPCRGGYGADLMPKVSYKSPKSNNDFQHDYWVAIDIVNEFAEKHKFVLDEEDFGKYFEFIRSYTRDFEHLYIWYDKKTDLICISVGGCPTPSSKLKEIVPELHDKLVSEFGERIKWQEYK